MDEISRRSDLMSDLDVMSPVTGIIFPEMFCPWLFTAASSLSSDRPVM